MNIVFATCYVLVVLVSELTLVYIALFLKRRKVERQPVVVATVSPVCGHLKCAAAIPY